jgi:ABC-type oligopeptide transport system substrate-binding subunit
VRGRFYVHQRNEITSVDPAMVIGQSEMRVIIGLFEGL